MIRRILTATILIPFVLISLLLFPLPVFILVLDALIFLAFREFSRLGSPFGEGLYPSSYLFALVAPWITGFCPSLFGLYLLGAALITLGWCVFSTRDVKNAFSTASGNVLALVYLAIPFSLIATYHQASHQEGNPSGPWELIMVMLLVWISDAAAYFVGRALGNHRITPIVSPNKTLEGYLAAVIFPVATVLLIGSYFLPGRSLGFFLAAGLLVSVAGATGDLFESTLKRGAEIKDTSNLIPGHGGILDRIDSLLFAVPAYYILTLVWA
jgi:phosphatidate cytidylyltransferase